MAARNDEKPRARDRVGDPATHREGDDLVVVAVDDERRHVDVGCLLERGEAVGDEEIRGDAGHAVRHGSGMDV